MYNESIERAKREEEEYYLQRQQELAKTDSEAEERYKSYAAKDPFPEIEPALLNSADIFSYVAKTGMLFPFDVKKLQGATYDVSLKGTAIWWDEEEKREYIRELIHPGDFFELKPNSIAFITLEPYFRIPEYLALRFNLRITHIYKGLLLGTGPIVDPGFVGRLSIPLHNLTANTYKFQVGDDIIQMEFTKLSSNKAWADCVARDTGLYKHKWITPGRTVREYLTRALINSRETVIKSSIPNEIAKISEEVVEAQKDIVEFEDRAEKNINRAQIINAAIMVSVAGMAVTALFQLGSANTVKKERIYDLEQAYEDLSQKYEQLEDKYLELEESIGSKSEEEEIDKSGNK